MATILALQKLFDDVETRFADEADPPPTMAFGWRESARQRWAAERIVWIPGDPSGNAGELAPPKQPGRNPRPLATFREFFHVRVEGYATANAETEINQWAATQLLFHSWWRAVYLAARGTVSVEAIAWDIGNNERRRGAALLVTCAIDSMIADTPHETAVPTDAEIEVIELDVTESLEVAS